MSIKRYFTVAYFEKIKKDCRFLVSTIRNSKGEYDLAIRENYFNLYFKGYSIAKIKPQRDGTYLVSIHKKFFESTHADDPKYYKSIDRKQYCAIHLNAKQLHPFLQVKHLSEFASKVKDLPSGEIGFEQAIITDNIGNENTIIIDRQISDTELKRKRLDLLALKKVEGNKYQFLILEVKLGNNKELKGQVDEQLRGYVNHVKKHFSFYKDCYEKQFNQKVELGLIERPKWIDIIEPVSGKVLVGGYSGIADPIIDVLRKTYPSLDIKHFKYAL